MDRRRRLFLVPFVATLVAPVSAWAFTLPNHSLFPLEEAAEWVYRVTTGEGSGTKRLRVESLVAGEETKTAKIAVEMSGVPAGRLKSTLEYALQGGRIHEAWSYATAVDVGTTPSSLLLPGREVLRIGHTWTTESGLRHQSPVSAGSYSMIERHEVVGWDWITVPAGRFYALEIATTVTLSGLERHEILGAIPVPSEVGSWTTWYAPFVGEVKTVSDEGTEELVSFNLKPDPCEYAVIGLDGTATMNGRELGAEIGYARLQKVATAERSWLEMLLGSGEILRVGESTSFELSRLTGCGRDDEAKTFSEAAAKVVRILLGKLWFAVTKLAPTKCPGARFCTEVHGTVTGGGVRGTEFSVEVTASDDVWEVVDGAVEVTYEKTGEVFTLKAGERQAFPH